MIRAGGGLDRIVAEQIHGSEIFRNGRNSRARQWRDHAGPGHEGGPSRRPVVSARTSSPSRRDRQGHAAFGLHDRDRHGGRLHLGRHGRDAARPHADARRRHADPLDAGRHRGDDLGIAQRLRGQWHQAVRSRRLQAVRRGREPRSSICWTRISATSCRNRPISGARPASTACMRATSNMPSGRCPGTSRWTACASSSIAPTGPPTRSRPKPCGNSAPRSFPSASSPTASTSTTMSARPRPRRSFARCGNCAPISASRSMAMPTGC